MTGKALKRGRSMVAAIGPCSHTDKYLRRSISSHPPLHGNRRLKRTGLVAVAHRRRVQAYVHVYILQLHYTSYTRYTSKVDGWERGRSTGFGSRIEAENQLGGADMHGCEGIHLYLATLRLERGHAERPEDVENQMLVGLLMP